MENRRWRIFKRTHPTPNAIWVAQLDSPSAYIHPIIQRSFKTWIDAMNYTTNTVRRIDEGSSAT